MSAFIYTCPDCKGNVGLVVIKGKLTCPVCKHIGLKPTEKKGKKNA